MTRTTSEEHAVLASGGDTVRRYLSVGGREAIVTAQITALRTDGDSGGVYGLDVADPEAVYTAILSAVGSAYAFNFLTIDIGTTSGARDVGMVRHRAGGSIFYVGIGETAAADVPIEVGHYLTVRFEALPWLVPKRIVVTRDGENNITAVTEYLDYAEPYSLSGHYYPKVNITAGENADGSPKEVKLAGFVDGYGTPQQKTYRTLYLTSQHSHVHEAGDYLETTTWNITGSHTFVGCLETDAAVTVRLGVGFHLIMLYGAADIGLNDVRVLPVWVHDDSDLPLTNFAVTSDETRYEDVPGREMQFEFFGNADDAGETALPERSLLCYWEEAEFNDGGAPESYRDQCMGWVFNDDPLLKREDSRYGVKIGATATWKSKFDVNSVTLIDTGSTPTTWTQLVDMTVDRVLDWSLKAVDTLRYLVNVYYSGVTAKVERMTLPLGSAWAHLQETAPKALLAQPACDSLGNLWLRIPTWALPAPARAVRVIALPVTADDWTDDDGFRLPTEFIPPVGLVNAAGELWDGSDRVLYGSVAPSKTSGMGLGKVKMPDQFLQLPNPQDVLNTLSGLYYAHENNKRRRLTLLLAGNMDVIEPAWGDPVSVTWLHDSVRGTELDERLHIVTHVSVQHVNEPNSQTPPKRVTWTLEEVTAGEAGKTVPVLQMEGVEQPAEDACEVTAGFTVDTSDCQVTFTNTTSGDLPLLYLWTFGDGAFSTAPNPTHVYVEAGTYSVTLHVFSECGDYDTYADDVAVAVGGESESVSAAFTYYYTAITALPFLEVTLQFTDASTTSTEIVAWLWDFGDGAFSTEQNPEHTYTAGDSQTTVTLTVTCICGSQATFTQVFETPPVPIAYHDFIDTSNITPTNRSFSCPVQTCKFGTGGADGDDDPCLLADDTTTANIRCHSVACIVTPPAGKKWRVTGVACLFKWDFVGGYGGVWRGILLNNSVHWTKSLETGLANAGWVDLFFPVTSIADINSVELAISTDSGGTSYAGSALRMDNIRIYGVEMDA